MLLALIGPQWLTITDERGQRRLENAEDFVRLEIRTALTRNVRVIPILIDNAQMPRIDELPPDLARLTRRQAVEISPTRFDTDTKRLMATVQNTLAEQARQQADDQARKPEGAPPVDISPLPIEPPDPVPDSTRTQVINLPTCAIDSGLRVGPSVDVRPP